MKMGFLNIFTLRRMMAMFLTAFIPTILFAVGTIWYNFWIGLGLFFLGVLLALVIANILLKNPFTAMLEGKGILVFNIDSTGVVSPFIVSLKPPYVVGALFKKKIIDVFDRGITFNFKQPKVKGTYDFETKEEENPKTKLMEKKSFLKIDIPEDDYNKARFGFFHYPLLIYNEQIGSFITKEFLSNKEKDTFAEHIVLYLNRKMEELTSLMRDFARYVIEALKPKENFFKSKMFLIIVVIVMLIILGLLSPYLIRTIQGFMGTATASLGGNTVIPK